MKKGLKFWSKLLIVSFFLGGMATSAIAQNGTRKANCASELQVITRTVDQMDSIGGTVIPIKFNVTANANLIGDKVYIVAESNGSLTTLDQTNCAGIGQNLKLVGTGTTATTVQDEATVANVNYTGTSDPNVLGNVVATIPSDGIVYVRVNRAPGYSIDADDDPTTPSFKLGVFIEDVAGEGATQCFSDVYWVSIQVINNIYATLNLHSTNVAKEYICSGTQTSTNIGFDLCGIPTSVIDARLYYAMTFVNNTGVTGMSLNDGVNTALSGTELYTLEIAPNSGAYSLRIGQQTLANTSPAVADSVTYEFLEGLDKFYLSYTEGGRPIKVPIIFITNEDNCTATTQTYTADQKSHKFTVHVAPAFTVEALAYLSADDRTNATNATTTFCQGTVAYLDANTSVTTGDNSVITTYGYNWTVAGNLATDANIEKPNSKELVNAGEDTYTFTVTAQWDDEQTDGVASGNWAAVTGIEGGAGCKITSAGLVIDVTAAPILLVATDKATSGDDQSWNSTDVITYNAPVCPGEIIKIETDTSATILATDDANDMTGVDDPRYNYMIAGDYVQANTATIKYTVSPNDADPAVGAYTTWRTVQAPDTENLNVAHHLNNGTTTSAQIIYTLENATTPNGSTVCALVKSDGSSLPNGQVKVVYNVSPRPTFGLAN